MISRLDKKEELNLLRKKLIANGDIPKHIAIIMDGNGRWAKKRALPRVAGHQEGINSVRDITEACGIFGVQYLTLYTFSTENWRRPEDEVSFLMRLIIKALRDERDRLHKNGVRLKVIGDMSGLPADVQDELLESIKYTAHNKGLTLILALNYSGRWEITNAIQLITKDVKEGKLQPGDITEDRVSQYLATKEIPDPELLIRTSNEARLSNFLLWQVAYSEFHIAKEPWPQFRALQLSHAIEDFQRRERRFGMTSEQIKKITSTKELTGAVYRSVSKI